MPLPGGAADKFGNRFEGRWTVYCLARILNEEAVCITLEPVGQLGEGVEFVLTLPDGSQEFHQVKRQNGGQGPWSLNNLASANVLFNFKKKLGTPNRRCVFVSTSSADQLERLCERATSAETERQFLDEFLRSKETAVDFSLLRQKWDACSEADAFHMLRQIRVETSAEPMLKREVDYRLETLVNGSPETYSPEACSAVLAQLALESIHKTLYADNIWQYLRENKLVRRMWANDPHVLVAVEAANDRYLRPIRAHDILGRPITRHEAATVMSMLQQAGGRRAILISGDAGTGKTGVGTEVLEQAQALGWPTLALRLDRLEPTQTPSLLGKQMELPGSPVTVLANIAQGRDCLLFIDQLDAVSTTSGRHPDFFDCVDDMIHHCSLHSNLHLVLSCRRFDLTGDERLRRLVGPKGIAAEVPVGCLPNDAVWQTINACGVEAGRLTDKQLALLSVPLHLKIFTETVLQQGGQVEATLADKTFTFSTLKDLYDSYWSVKSLAAKQRLGREPNWGQAFDLFLERAMRDQSLSVPTVILDDFDSDRAILISEGVFVQQEKRLLFFHETFFDYAFARRFVSRGQSLLDYLQTREQHLFLRATVRQVLNHEREEDFATYLHDLQGILKADDIRFHLKRLVFQWLRTLPTPIHEEWESVCGLFQHPSASIKEQAWGVPLSAPWFALLDDLGVIRSELESVQEERVERMVGYLGMMVREVPDRVAEIAHTFIDKPDPWPQRALAIFSRSDATRARGLVDLYLKLVEKDVFVDSGVPFSSNSYVFGLYEVPDKQPAWGVEVLEAWLRQLVRHQGESGNLNPFTKDRYGDTGDRLTKLALGAPEEFTKYILPIVLDLARMNALRDGTPPWQDEIWRYSYFSSHYSLPDQLREALVVALCALAERGTETFAAHTAYIRQYADLRLAGFLLARAYTANGKRYADEASDFLAETPEWLELGWSDASFWISRRLIESISPFCSPDALERLERAVMNFYPVRERRRPRSLGYSQLALLNGLPEDRQSPTVRRRLGELRRKFEVRDVNPPRGSLGGAVGPPFVARWERMKDGHWLRAIAKYHDDGYQRGLLQGGARELAQVVKERAQQQPLRFVRLLLRLPDDTNPVYFEYILWGLAEGVKTDPEAIWTVLRRCHRLPGRPCRMFLSNVLRAYSGADMPPDIVELAAWYAVEAKDEKKENNALAISSDNEVLEMGGLNSVRGGMAGSISSLLFDHPELFHPVQGTLEKMVADVSVEVRTQVAEALLPVLNVDRDVAVKLFLQLCDTPHDALLACHGVWQFLCHAYRTHLSELMPLLDRMLASGNPRVVEAGARGVCLAALSDPDALSRADGCLNGEELSRKAAAQVASANIMRASDRAWCERVLTELFDDDSKQVREVAGQVFQEFQKDDLKHFPNMIEAFICSRAFQDNAFWFFQALETTTALLPDAVCGACERVVSMLSDPGVSSHQRMERSAGRNNDIVLRLYERTASPEVKRRCLDIIDLTLQYDLYGMEHALSDRES